MFEPLLNEEYSFIEKIGLKRFCFSPTYYLTTVHFQIYLIAIEDKVRLQLTEH
jgi:regulator of sigma D